MRTARARCARTLVCALVSGAGAPVVCAQDLVLAGPGARAPKDGAGHAWLLIREPHPPSGKDATDNALVFHFAPQDGGSSAESPAFRYAAELTDWPDACAAFANRLTLSAVNRPKAITGFPPAPSRPTEVVYWWTEQVEGRWVTLPVQAPRALRALPPGRSVRSMAANSQGVFALLGVGPSEVAGQPPVREASLRALVRGDWETLTLPPKAEAQTLAMGAVGAVYAWSRGVVLVQGADETGDGVRMWVGVVSPGQRRAAWFDEDDQAETPTTAQAPSEQSRTTIAWSELPLPTRAKGERVPSRVLVTTCDDELVLGEVIGRELHVRTVQIAPVVSAAWRTPAVIKLDGYTPSASPADLAITGITSGAGDGGRGGGDQLVAVWRAATNGNSSAGEGTPTNTPPAKAPASAGDPPLRGLNFAQVSLGTGRVMRTGEVQAEGVVRSADLRLIGVPLAWVIGLVALVVARPKDVELHVPDGCALAEPGRRLLAGTVDVILAGIAAGLVAGKSPMTVLTSSVSGLFMTLDGQTLLLLTLGLGAVLGTLGEATTGRTPGKALCGVAVADLSNAHTAAGRPPTLARTFVRNVVKWFLPPAGLVGVFGMTGRHRGDEYARAGVVMSAPEEPEDEDFE